MALANTGGVQTQFSTDPNAIVTVHVSIIEAPTPINYQRTGALVSFGATTLPAGWTELLTELADLAVPPLDNPTGSPIMPVGMAVTSVTWAAGVATLHLASAMSFSLANGSSGPPVNGDIIPMVLTGFVPSVFTNTPLINGLKNCTVTNPTTLTFPATTDPTPITTLGTILPHKCIELSQMATTFFGQGNEIGVWILELGYDNNPTNNVTSLQTWINQNPHTIYGFLMPRKFGCDPSILGTASVPLPFTSLLKQFEAPSNTMEYFWLTVASGGVNGFQPIWTVETYQNLFYPGQLGSGGTKGIGSSFKDVIQMVEAPVLQDPNLIYFPASGVDPAQYITPNYLDPNGEFTIAAMFYNALAYRPSNTNRITPMAFKFLYGVTEYPQRNNAPLLRSFKSANTNYVSTGAEGGIAFTMVYEGVTLDGHDYFNWWYTIDWVQIEINLNLSNAIINGSNNPLAPLYYNQDGINYLETVLFSTMQDASTFGMVLGKIEMTGYDGPDLTAAINGGQFAGKCNVNAVPFLNYTLANPGDYKIGEYDGLSTLFIPARGFIHILVNVVATDLVSL
jgi:hypothetical protein